MEHWSTVKEIQAGQWKQDIAYAVEALTADALAEPVQFARQAQLATSRLPETVSEALVDFMNYGNGALLFSGLEVGSIGPTPDSPIGAETGGTLMAKQAAVLLARVADLVGYRPESGGELVQTIVPTRRDAHRQTSTGSAVTLETHTEQCFNLLTRPDILALGGLRGDPHALTYLLSARELQGRLPGNTIDLLRQPVFYTRVDPSFVDGGVVDEIRGPMRVLDGLWEDPTIAFDEDLMFSPSVEHQEAIVAVLEVWRHHRTSVALRPGDVLLIDNSRAIHGRSSFQPLWDDNDRWLCRLQGLCNLAATRFARQPGSRIIEISGC